VANTGYLGVVEADDVALVGANLIFENMPPPVLLAGVPKEGVPPKETFPVDFLYQNSMTKEKIESEICCCSWLEQKIDLI
jgi:hypothetical protein